MTDPKTETRKTLLIGLAVAGGAAGLFLVATAFRPSDASTSPPREAVQGKGPTGSKIEYDAQGMPIPPKITEQEALRLREAARAKSRVDRKAGAGGSNDPGEPIFGKLTPEERDERRAIVMDQTRRPIDRCMAWKSLQMSKDHTPELTEPVIQILRTTTDFQLRRTIMDYFAGDKTEVIKAEVIRCLQNDESDFVRENAARALVRMFPDDHARAALERAMLTDSSDHVKAIARTALGK